MRLILILILAIAATSTANAQRVFRASSIDLEQNDRLDNLESQVNRIESSVSALVAAIESRTVKESLTVAKPKPEPPAEKLTVDKGDSPYYSQAELIAIVKDEYPRGDYTRYATMDNNANVFRHLKSDSHGFTSSQVDGMPQDIALGLHGLEHKGKITPYRGSAPAKPKPAPQPAKAEAVSASESESYCPNGQCARPLTVRPVQRVRLLNFLRR